MLAVRPGPTPIRDTAAQDRLIERPSRWRRRAVFGAAVGALVIGAVLVTVRWLGSDRSVGGDRVRTAAVTRGTLVRDAAVTGRVVAAVSPTLYAPRAGAVTLAIRAGDTVKKDQVLATIDSPELAAELARERSTLDQLDAQEGSARIGTERARLQARREADEAAIALTAATRDLARAEQAAKLGAIPEIDYLKAKDALETARVRDKNARAAADLAEKSSGFDLKTAEKQHERQKLAVDELERRVAELTIRAPVDGVIGTLSVADRAVVPANAPLMTVVDLSRLEVELEVPETYAEDLGIGMKADVDVGDGRARGTLSAISPEVVGGHVLARVRFDGAQPAGLRQSQRVAARILIDQRAGVLMVPRGPWLDAHGGRAIYRIEDGVAVKRPVRVGATSISSVEILDGLAPGDRVVVAGSEEFGDAARVRIND